MTLPWFRKRIPSDTPITVSQQGKFSAPPPPGDNQRDVYPFSGPYHFHQGDVFLPATGNFALDMPYNIPAVWDWGNGVPRNAFAFQPMAAQTVYQQPAVDYSAIRGIIPTSGVYATRREDFNG